MDSVTATAPTVITLAPNCSLSRRGAGLFLLTVSLPPLGMSVWMTAQGFWPVLPFAGLELALLAWALRLSMARARNLQVIRIDDARIEIETRHGAEVDTMVFTRHWAQVKLRRARTPWHPSQLMIQSHGRACEVGSFMTEAARGSLARRLSGLVGRVNESPPLGRPDCNIKV